MMEARTSAAARGSELRDVAGPSALGGGRRRFFELLYLIAVTEFKRTYFGTALGYVWSLVRPLLLFAVLLFVFTQIFRLGSEVPNYPVLLLFNVVLFTFFQEATSASVMSVVNQESVVRKTQFPRLVIPLAVVLTGLFNLGLNLIAVFIFILAYGVDPIWGWLLLPVVVALLAVLTTAVSMLLSSLFVRFRDVQIIWSVLVMALFYGTPLLYPLELVPQRFQDLILLNPLTPLFVQARHWIIDPSAETAVEAAGSWLALAPSILIFAGICAIAVVTFNRAAPHIAEEL
jgi:ABC-2 type transport system permease protein